MLSLKNVSVSADKKPILRGIDFSFALGKVYVIMGPNGSGKSTLAHTISGNPVFSLAKESEIALDKKSLRTISPEERTKRGVFLTFQSPVALPGINIFELLRIALAGKMDAATIRKNVTALAKSLAIDAALLDRPLNEDFSGGEKKKMEVLQAAMLGGKYLIFDEIDSGTDVDARKMIGTFLQTLKKGRCIIIITHSTKILESVSPDHVLVMRDGKIIADGGPELAEQIEKDGYNGITGSNAAN